MNHSGGICKTYIALQVFTAPKLFTNSYDLDSSNGPPPAVGRNAAKKVSDTPRHLAPADFVFCHLQ